MARWSTPSSHNDVLYRCQRLLDLQGQACAPGRSDRLRRPFVYDESNQQAGRDLADALAYLRDQQRPQWQRLLGSLDLLVHNLRSIERRLLDAERSEASLDNVDTRLRDSNPHTLREMACASASSSRPARCYSAMACAWRWR